jgi:hypothetical protein
MIDKPASTKELDPSEAWAAFCRDPEAYERRNSPEYVAGKEAERQTLEEHPLWGIF